MSCMAIGVNLSVTDFNLNETVKSKAWFIYFQVKYFVKHKGQEGDEPFTNKQKHDRKSIVFIMTSIIDLLFFN